MIAAGLCLMGGCFAQDEAGATVETYWPSDNVDISKNQISLIYRNAFPGGSSESDIYRACVYMDLLTPPAAIVNETMPLGYANAQLADGSFLMSGVYPVAYRNKMRFMYGGIYVEVPIFSGLLQVEAKNSECRWTLDGAELATQNTTFELAADNTRNCFIRTGQIRQFVYMAYSNNETGVKWMINAMQSVTRKNALWSNDTLTLTEI